MEVDESEVGNNLLANLTRFASHKPPTIPPRQNFAPYEASSIVCKYWSPRGATRMGYNFGHQLLLCSNHMHMHMLCSAVSSIGHCGYHSINMRREALPGGEDVSLIR